MESERLTEGTVGVQGLTAATHGSESGCKRGRMRGQKDGEDERQLMATYSNVFHEMVKGMAPQEKQGVLDWDLFPFEKHQLHGMEKGGESAMV